MQKEMKSYNKCSSMIRKNETKPIKWLWNKRLRDLRKKMKAKYSYESNSCDKFTLQ